MSGRAIALLVQSQSMEVDGRVSLKLECAVSGDSDEPLEGVYLDVRFAPDATPAQIENAIEDEIIFRVGELHPELDIPRNRMIYLDVKRGAA